MLCQQHWWLVPSLFSHYFPLLRFLLQKPLADSLVLGGSKGLTSNLLFPKTFRYHFSDPLFGCFTFCHFFQIGKFSFIRIKDPQPPPFMVHLLGFPELPDPFSWVASSQIFCPFLASLGGRWDTFVFILCVPWHAPLSCLNLNLALLHIPRILGFWESPSILVQFSLWVPQQFSS